MYLQMPKNLVKMETKKSRTLVKGKKEIYSVTTAVGERPPYGTELDWALCGANWNFKG